MHPILFRIPLPNRPLMLWWALAAVGVIALFYVVTAMRRQDRTTAGIAAVVAVGCGVAGYVFRETKYGPLPNLPIYSYGVMLGVSLVVGWYLTLTLAGRDGLPKETMANCYVITAFAAILGSRVLYIATNPDEFKQASDIFALRRGGLVAYGGFLGGYLGSWLFLQRHKIKLMPWADVAVPSLASGLLITRIGCYLFGCDFGKRLPATAPAFLKKLGTFPHWAGTMAEGGDGSPAYVRHLELFRGTPLGGEIMKANASLPVHPTQIYESLVGLFLLGLCLWQRKHQKFRGQIFFTFTFGYGVLRFLLEILRDDTERGEWGPVGSEHVMIPAALLAMSLAFIFGVALGIENERARTVARVAALAPPIVAFVLLRPASFGASISIQFSTSQWIALLSALAVAFFYARFWEAARKAPKAAMSLATLGEIFDKEDDDAKKARKKKKKEEAAKPDAEKAKDAEKAASKDDESEDDADDDERDEDERDEDEDEPPASEKPEAPAGAGDKKPQPAEKSKKSETEKTEERD